MTASRHFYVPLYSATLLLSAFLLFMVQPMFGKMILPLLGGTPAVWNLAMVFFQAALLGGYLYAHLLSRLSSVRLQACLHILLLLAFALALPIAIPPGWEPPATDNPAFWQLRLMTVAAGGPFFALSATAPLLQHWFSRTAHPDAQNPYFLYAASNIGSLSALLLYPLAFEPLLALREQSLGWSGGYALLALLTAVCAFLSGGEAKTTQHLQPANDERLTVRQIALWLVLAFIPSSLMLGVTTFITTDLASAPLLWIIPLALYVGTFVIAFARHWPFRLERVIFWQGVMFVAVIAAFISGAWLNIALVIALHLGLFALTALLCHMQLASLRPQTRHLTAFYLIMSAGGVLGGIFNALIAPRMFILPVEYALVLALSAFVRYLTDPQQSLIKLRAKLRGEAILLAVAAAVGMAGACYFVLTLPAGLMRFAGVGLLCAGLLFVARRRWVFVGFVALVLALHPGFDLRHVKGALLWKRNFFGVMKVADAPAAGVRLFMHGTTVHGAQPLDPKYRLMPISYYHPDGPAADTFQLLDMHKGPQQVAVLGLGIGVTACYARPGRHFDFYEIDPDVGVIAEDPKLFTYLKDCGSPYGLIIGDARLKIAKAPDHSYDMIFVDTFSSDNIPVHLITSEAFDLYRRKLKPDGIIVVNISNRHLALEPVIAAAGRDLGMRALFLSMRDGLIKGTKIMHAGSMFAVLAPQQKTLDPLVAKGWHPLPLGEDRKAWRDDFSNIVSAIRLHAPNADK